MDKLAVEEAGIRYCVSVPDGAPNPKSTPSQEDKVPEILGGTLQVRRDCQWPLPSSSS